MQIVRSGKKHRTRWRNSVIIRILFRVTLRYRNRVTDALKKKNRMYLRPEQRNRSDAKDTRHVNNNKTSCPHGNNTRLVGRTINLRMAGHDYCVIR